MATPHVAGRRGDADAAGHHHPAAIEAALERFATDLRRPPAATTTYGFGLIDARNTLRGLGLAK